MQTKIEPSVYQSIAVANRKLFVELSKVDLRCSIIPKGSTVCFGLTAQDDPELDLTLVFDEDSEACLETVIPKMVQSGFEVQERPNCYIFQIHGVKLDVSVATKCNDRGLVRCTAPNGIKGKYSCPFPYTSWIAEANSDTASYFRVLCNGDVVTPGGVNCLNDFSVTFREIKRINDFLLDNQVKKIPSFILLHFLRSTWNPSQSTGDNLETALGLFVERLVKQNAKNSLLVVKNPFSSRVILTDRWPGCINEQKKLPELISAWQKQRKK